MTPCDTVLLNTIQEHTLDKYFVAGGSSSSSSTSTSSGGTNDNRNVYYECTGPNCSSVKPAATAAPASQPPIRNQLVTQPTPPPTVPPGVDVLRNITFPKGANPNLNIPPGLVPPPDLQEALDLGGNVNLNCDYVNGCPTLLPPSRTSTTSTTTTVRPPIFQISFSPLFGGLNRRTPPTEAATGVQAASVNSEAVQKTNNSLGEEEKEEVAELPTAGLGEDFINEVYQLDEDGKDMFTIVRLNSQEDRLVNRLTAGLNNNNKKKDNSLLGLSDGDDKKTSLESGSTKKEGEDIKEVLQAIRSLLEILNTTSQGKRRPGLKTKGNRTAQPLHKGAPVLHPQRPDSAYQVQDIVLDGDAFSRIQSVRLPGLDRTVLVNTKHVPHPPHVQGGDEGNYKTKNENTNKAVTSIPSSTTTIPPHLIPLGPDGRPILRPDGSLVNAAAAAAGGGHVGGQQHQLSHMFPYLSTAEDNVSTASSTVATVENTTSAEVNDTLTGEKAAREHKDMITSMIDTVRDLPMDTKRHMLANMMFGVPMAAITMAAAGVPHLAIAPLATLIPGFLFAAFTDTNPMPRAEDPHGGHGHGHGHNNAHGGHGHDAGLEREGSGHHDGQGEGGSQFPQRGLAGLIAGLRQLYTHRRQDQTLHIVTDNAHGHHGK